MMAPPTNPKPRQQGVKRHHPRQTGRHGRNLFQNGLNVIAIIGNDLVKTPFNSAIQPVQSDLDKQRNINLSVEGSRTCPLSHPSHQTA
jgi:hypothetical protein